MRTPGPRDRFPIPRVQLSQSYDSGIPPELLYVQGFFGGCIHQNRRGGEVQRSSWTLDISSLKQVFPVLETLSRHCIVKKREALLALEYLRECRVDPFRIHQELLKAKRERHAIVVDSAQVSKPYAAGLFAAEGSIGMYRENGTLVLSSTIAQQQCIPVLQAIREMLGFGRVANNAVLRFSGNQTMEFIAIIRPFLYAGQKVAQIDAVIESEKVRKPLDGRRRHREEDERREELRVILKKMKRG